MKRARGRTTHTNLLANLVAAICGVFLMLSLAYLGHRIELRVKQQRIKHSGGIMAKKKIRRTTHRSVSGTKLYAVRDARGRFKDIQTYKRAHGSDIKRSSKAEKKRKK